MVVFKERNLVQNWTMALRRIVVQMKSWSDKLLLRAESLPVSEKGALSKTTLLLSLLLLLLDLIPSYLKLIFNCRFYLPWHLCLLHFDHHHVTCWNAKLVITFMRWVDFGTICKWRSQGNEMVIDIGPHSHSWVRRMSVDS